MTILTDPGALARQTEFINAIGGRVNNETLPKLMLRYGALEIYRDMLARTKDGPFDASMTQAEASFPRALGAWQGRNGKLWHILCAARAHDGLAQALEAVQDAFPGIEEVREAVNAFLFGELLARTNEATFGTMAAYALSAGLVVDPDICTSAADPTRGTVSQRASALGTALAKKRTLKLAALKDILDGLTR